MSPLLVIVPVLLFLFGRKRSAPVSSGPGVPVARDRYMDAQYPPNDSRTYALLESALAYALLPREWAQDSALHSLLRRESNGYVGIPNYHFGDLAKPENSARWPEVWDAVRKNAWRTMVLAKYQSAPSSATGLGQMIRDNARRLYPSGLDGIGNALEEAVGFVKYVAERYGTPAAAWAHEQTYGWY